MAYVGQIITNPVSGEQIEFLATAAYTNGECLVIELRLAPDGKVPGMHVHPEQEERFEVLEGRMKFRMGLRKIEAGPGDVVTVPAARRTSSRTPATPARWSRSPSPRRWRWSACSRPPSSWPRRAG